jgi:diguanylate cyclase (GGDEF)-like protein
MAMERLTILFVDDEPTDVRLAQYELQRDGLSFTSHTVSNESGLERALTELEPDVVLCDYTIPGFSGLHALEMVRRLCPFTPVLMISGSVPEDTVIECLARGATDYLLKTSLRRLAPAVRRALAERRERLAYEERIDQLSHYDSLTGLPNLRHVNEGLPRALEHVRAAQRLLALVVLNLDRFRFLDERLGRTLADQMLKAIAAALRADAREQDVVARIGPDEFLILLPDLDAATEAAMLVQRMLIAIARSRQVASEVVQITASAGVALYPNDGADFECLLCKATEAMHEAKVTARGSWQFHSSEVVRHAQEQRQLESGLRVAIQRNALTLHFQAQFDIRTGRACGIEALARWFPADGHAVAPSVFIPLAEQSGLIGDLGSWALREGCRLATEEWAGGHDRLPTVCVNVSTHQICEAFTAVIANALEVSGLSPKRLELEITESVLIDNANATLACLAQWKALGVRIAVDDFGTGYSSLSYLSRLPVDRLKMDRSLIHSMTHDAKDAAIVRAVVSLGRELGFTVLAEGVETEEQLDMLAALGCEQVQGYLIAPPLPAAQAHALMRRRWGARKLSVAAAGARSRAIPLSVPTPNRRSLP